MRRLKILHLIDLEKVGGVESMFVDFIQATPPAGMTVEHYTIADSPKLASRFVEPVQRRSQLLATPRQWLGIKLPRRPHWIRARRRLQLIRQVKPDLVLAWNQFTDFRVADLRLGCPLIYYEHGMSWYTHSERQLNGFLPHVRGAIAVSHAAARMLQLKHGVHFEIDECPNPVRPGLMVAGAEPRELDSSRPLRIGVAARLVPLKAVALLVLAIKQLLARGVAVEAVIAGEGPERLALENLIAREKLTAQVRLLGLIEDMHSFYADIDLFVCTSMHETLGLVVLEAMSHGVPVIACHVDGLAEVLRSGDNGLLLEPMLGVNDYAALTGASTDFTRTVYSPGQDTLVAASLMEPQQIADAVVSLTASPAIYRRFSEAALKAQAEVPTYSQFIERIYSLLLKYAPL